MPVTIEHFGKALTAAGILSPDELKEFWAALPAGGRPKSGDELSARLVAAGKLTQFQADELLAGRGAALVMGDYVLVDELGAGGMGKVYKARHRTMQRIVALKVMSSAAMQDEAAVKRFQREVRAAAKLEHPNIVTAYDSGTAGKVKYLVMQFVDGGDLASLVRKQGVLDVERAVEYVCQTAQGLAFAHAEGVVHRDIKPANLLVDKRGVVKILDMGLARIDDSSGSDGLTGTEQVMGTVDYMSPEQAADTKHVDARTDVYSLGCTLWYLLTGKRMFDGDTAIKRLMKHRDQPRPSLVKARDDVTWPLEQVFHKMVAVEPQNRYQSMDEVFAALESHRPTRSSGSATGMGSSLGMGGGPRDAELSAFLKTVGPVGAKGGTTTKSPTAAADAATAMHMPGQVETDPKSEQLPGLPFAATQRTDGPPWKLIAGGVAVCAAMVIAAVLFVTRGGDDSTLLPPGEATRRADEGAKPTGVTGTGRLTSTARAAIALTANPASAGRFNFPASMTTAERHHAIAQWVVGKPGAGMIQAIAYGQGHRRYDNGVVVPPAPDFRITQIGISAEKQVTPDEYRMLLELETLEAIGGYATGLKNAHLEQLAYASPTLISVSVEKSDFDDDGLAHLGKLPQLKSLTIGQNHLWGDKGIGHLSGLVNLESFAVRISNFGDAGLTVVAKFSKLKTLNASNTWVTDRGLEHLKSLKYLVALDVKESQVTEKGVKNLHVALPACRITWDGGVLEPTAPPPTEASPTPAVTMFGLTPVVPPPGDYALEFGKSQTKPFAIPGWNYQGDTPLTIEAWMTLRVNQYQLVLGNAKGTRGVHLGQQPDGTLVLFMESDGKRHKMVSDQAPSTDRRLHLAVTYDEFSTRMFVDGVEQNKSKKHMYVPSPWPFFIGASSSTDGNPVDGCQAVLDEVRISRVVRYAENFTPPARHEPDADTEVLYHFDEGAGDTARDSSPHARHAKLETPTWVKSDGTPPTP